MKKYRIGIAIVLATGICCSGCYYNPPSMEFTDRYSRADSLSVGGLRLYPRYQMPATTPYDFTFSYSFGYGNILNGFNHTYTHDMVADPDITIPFDLSWHDVVRIYALMKEMDLFNYPPSSSHGGGGSFSRTVVYDIRINGIRRKFSVTVPSLRDTDDHASPGVRLDRLMQEVINSYPKIQALPKPRSGYL